MIKQLTLAVSVALCSVPLLTACDDDNPQVQQYDYDNVVAAAQATPDLSVLVEAVVAADLAGTLSKTDSPAPYTVFAPTNDAFVALLNTLGVTKEQLLADKDLLTKVLTYHVVPNAVVKKADIPFGQPIQTINGNALSIDADADGNAKIMDAAGNSAGIVQTDVVTGNGVVHIIDSVILPATKNLVEVAQGNSDFSILVEAVNAAGLADTLATTKNLTVFAPTNSAFAALLSELGVSKDALLADKALLKDVLTYHVVQDLVYSSEVAAGNVKTLQGSNFTFGADTKITDARGRQASLVVTDVQATNGVIHAIDKVILPAAK